MTDTASPIGIVLVNYASSEVIDRNLGRIDLSALPCRVVVVDNFSSVREAEAIGSMADRAGWDLVRMDGNAGFGSAVNVGVARARELGCECYLILNPDASTTATVIDDLRTACLADRRALITPVIERPDGTIWFQGGRIGITWGGLLSPTRKADEQGRAWLTAACLAVHQDMWDDLGGFDDDYFLYWEDVDLSYRCQQLGGRLTIRSDLRAVHEVGATQGQGGKSAVYNFYNCRNRLLFAAKHLTWRHRVIWLLQTPMDTVRVLMRGGRGEIFNLRRVLWPGLRGVAGGVQWMFANKPQQLARPPERASAE
jgi:N-acetylglucosaminyl-diphospho-decaprenol L-rhamnosyltransferase